MHKMSSPFSIRHWDSNPLPLEHESSPITTRPGFRVTLNNLTTSFYLRTCVWFIQSFCLAVHSIWTSSNDDQRINSIPAPENTHCRGKNHCTYGWSPVYLDLIWPKQEKMLSFICCEAVESSLVKLETSLTVTLLLWWVFSAFAHL